MSGLELTGPLSIHSPFCLFIRYDTHFFLLTAYLLLVTSAEKMLKYKDGSFLWTAVQIWRVAPVSQMDKQQGQHVKTSEVN